MSKRYLWGVAVGVVSSLAAQPVEPIRITDYRADHPEASAYTQDFASLAGGLPTGDLGQDQVAQDGEWESWQAQFVQAVFPVAFFRLKVER